MTASWKDFQFEYFKPWWDGLIVEDVVPSSSYDAVYRLFGTHVVTLFEADLTGKYMTEVEGFLTQSDIEMSMKMVSRQLIGIYTGPMMWRKRSHKSYTLIDLSLADDGCTVDKFLSLILPIPSPNTEL